MSTGALFHCVCGTDFPVSSCDDATGNGVMLCPRCGRRHAVSQEGEPLPSETATVRREDLSISSTATFGAPHSPDWPDRSSAPADLVGKSLDHFEIIEEIGSGGMGTVYRALDRSLERFVAIKVINAREICGNSKLLEAFVHEARAQARINHPGIVTIYYIGRCRTEGITEEQPYFAMELLSGTDLESRLRDGGPLDFTTVVACGLQIVGALDEANQRGVIHRDIKPGNMILTESGLIKLTDFGLSKTEMGGVQITGSRTITGTPYYLSPEQARGESTDFRSDIYSLGATLYHLAYGQPPFPGKNFMGVVANHLSDPVTFPDSSPLDIPESFKTLIRRMMAKRPEDRFQSYDDLSRALRDLEPRNRVVASMVRRAVAAALDYVIIMMLVGLLVGVVAAVGRWLWREPEAWVAHSGLLLGGLYVLAMVYQVCRGRTLGKDFGHLRIARVDGERPGAGRLAARFLFQTFPIAGLAVRDILLGFGVAWSPVQDLRSLLVPLGVTAVDFIWAFTNSRRRTLHDVLLGTWVVERREA